MRCRIVVYRSQMRLLHIITGLNLGGAERFLFELLKGLPPRIESSVISLSDLGVIGDNIRTSGIPISSLGMKSRMSVRAPIQKLRDMIKEARPDIVQTWMYHADLLGGIAARWAGVSTVIWTIRHGALSFRHDKWRTIAVARICAALSSRIPNQIICCAESARATHVQFGYANDRMIVLRNGFDLSHSEQPEESYATVRRSLGVSTDVPLVTLVARFHPLKGHRILIDAAAKLHNRWPHVHYVLAGTGVDSANPTLAKWLQQHKLQSSFSLLGARNDIPRLLGGVDVLVAPSLVEAFPNSVGEAMSHGVPCIVTDVGDAPYLVGDTGFVVPPANAQALADALEQFLLLPKATRRSLGLQAQRRIQENFGLDMVIRQYTEFYDRLYEQHGHLESQSRR